MKSKILTLKDKSKIEIFQYGDRNLTKKDKHILFFPGGGVDLQYYSLLLESLSNKLNITVTAFNLMGRGHMNVLENGDIARTVKILDEAISIAATDPELQFPSGSKAYLIGHSLGGGLAIALSKYSAFHFQRVIAICPLLVGLNHGFFHSVYEVIRSFLHEYKYTPNMFHSKTKSFTHALRRLRGTYEHYVFARKFSLAEYIAALPKGAEGKQHSENQNLEIILGETDSLLTLKMQVRALNSLAELSPKVRVIKRGGHNLIFSNLLEIIGDMS